MRLMYFFDKHLKPHMMKGKRYCKPSSTGVYEAGISCIRQHDVNLWFYTKDGDTIAIDAGHLDFPSVETSFSEIGVDPLKIEHVLITHADVDHCGGIDALAKTYIYPNAKVYLGEEEELYLTGATYRIKKFGLKIKNCVKLRSGYQKLEDGVVLALGNIKVQALHIPGHTLGHMCYIVDDKVLFSGDCLAVCDEGGYSFFEFFNQDTELNKKSLIRLRDIVMKSDVQYVCTGHSGLRTDMEKLFKHIELSAGSDNKPFDKSAPYDIRD